MCLDLLVPEDIRTRGVCRWYLTRPTATTRIRTGRNRQEETGQLLSPHIANIFMYVRFAAMDAVLCVHTVRRFRMYDMMGFREVATHTMVLAMVAAEKCAQLI